MSRRLAVAVAIALALKSLSATGATDAIVSYRPWIDRSLMGGILSNLIVVIVFAEIYWQVDRTPNAEDQEHFGFESVLDAYYFSVVTSSSVGYGDILPRTRKAKMLTIAHIVSMFFTMLPMVLKALEH